MTVCAECGHSSAEPFKFCPECGAAVEAPAAREQRKTVTVLFCDVTGSTSLGESTDPEALRALLARYFERMKAIVESHGGTVEKFIGDAVMAVFGVPQVHEDDALRAVRAAVEMRDVLPELGVQARIGVNTGEVVTGTEERLATGDAVNVAARLEQAAAAGEILIGEETLNLVRDAVETESVEPLQLKGKAEPVPAFRLRGVSGELERLHATRFVGRASEIGLIHEAWKRATEERSCELVTIVGEPGVGKSRLVAEAISSIPAPVVRGRCLSYGEGITYWPIVEVIKQLDVLPSDEAAASAIRSVLGESDRPTTSDEIAWAFRKLLEQEAPVVCIFDDIQWAEDTFLDLVEQVALFVGGAPLLLVCTSRPELSERRPQWSVLHLEPLSVDAVEELIPDAIPDDLRERIERAAGGNPLFVQEMVAMAEESSGDVVVPPNLQALIAARLDQLEGEERSVLERGSIEGEVFHRGSVQALAENGQVKTQLAALVRKALVRPDRSQLPGDDAFRFRHLLIRDAAYDALPKAERAELHERFAAWLEEHGTDLVELDEILGYHLEQAFRYRKELGQQPDETLGASARERLVSAGHRAILRGDDRAARALLERAVELAPEGEIDPVEFELVDVEFGLNMEDAQRRAHSLAERAVECGDDTARLMAEVLETQVRAWTDPEGASGRLQELATELVRVAEESGDDYARYVANFGLVVFCHMRCLFDDELDYIDNCSAAGRRLGLRHLELAYVRFGGSSRTFGTRVSMDESIEWLNGLKAAGVRDPSLHLNRIGALGFAGRFDEARAVIAEASAEFEERGAVVPLALLKGMLVPEVENLAHNPKAAVEAGEEGCAQLEQVGDKGWLSTASAELAESYIQLEDLDRAYELSVRSEDLGASDDMANEERWRLARAKILARRRQFEEAETLAREALAISERTQHLDSWSHMTLGEVLERAGRTDEAVGWYERAREGFAQKGIVTAADEARQRLESLGQFDQ